MRELAAVMIDRARCLGQIEALRQRLIELKSEAAALSRAESEASLDKGPGGE